MAVILVYEPGSTRGRPLPIARVEDAGVLRLAASAAVAEARLRAYRMAQSDALLARLEQEEAARLQRVIKLLMPPVT